MPSDRLPEIVRRYLDAYARRDVDAMLATFADDVVFEHLSNASPPVRTEGLAALEALARQSVGLFSARRQVVVDAVVQGDHVAVRVRFEATVAAELPNGWRAGQEIVLHGASFFTLRDGRIARLVDLA